MYTDVFLLLNWLKLFLILLPLFLVGITLVNISSLVRRAELVIPAALILGPTFFIFFLNIFSYFFRGSPAIISAYFFTLVFGFVLSMNYPASELRGIASRKFLSHYIVTAQQAARYYVTIKFNKGNTDFPKGKPLIFWLISLGVWSVFVFWKAAFALIGGDSSIYYSIASSFASGNYPPVTPWQPDTPLSYHLGSLELLGALNLFTSISFGFLHRFLAAIFIICSIQIILWIWKRHEDLLSFILTNLVAAVVFISFGFLKLIIPVFPLEFPVIHNLKDFILWSRNLPTVYESIETYGAPVTLDGLMYAIFHAHGIAIFFSLLILVVAPKKSNSKITWIFLLLFLAILALVNESIFVAAFPGFIVGIVFHLIRTNFKSLKILIKELSILLLLILFCIFIVLTQGGVISANTRGSDVTYKSVIIFPKKTDIKGDFTAYHINSMRSRVHQINKNWLPFKWFHIGIDILFLLSLLIFLKMRFLDNERIILLVLIATSFFALIAYNVIVPKYIFANSNRILAVAFQLLVLAIGLSLTASIKKIVNGANSVLKFTLIFIIIWLFLPTIIPPLAKLSQTRFGSNKLVPQSEPRDIGINWLKDNLSLNERVVVLDINAPHPSGDAKALINGILAPLFKGGFRTYNIDAGPEYVDIVYTLSPKALDSLKISIILIDQNFFSKMPEVRQRHLNASTFFEKLYEYVKPDGSWERIYKVKSLYLSKGGELPGTITELISLVSSNKRVYIDNEDNFHLNFLRRPLIFALRNNELFFTAGSGVYQHVELPIPQNDPKKDDVYDYLLLGKSSDPQKICLCRLQLIWKGLDNEVYLWIKV